MFHVFSGILAFFGTLVESCQNPHINSASIIGLFGDPLTQVLVQSLANEMPVFALDENNGCE